MMMMMSFMMMFVVIVSVVVEVEIGNDEVVCVVPNHSIYVYRYVERMSTTTTTTTTNANKKVEEEMREGDFVARLCFKCACVFCVEYYYHCVTNFRCTVLFFVRRHFLNPKIV